MDSFDREEQAIEDAYASGAITDAQMRHELRELQRDYRAMVEDEVHRAADERRADFY